MTDEGSGLWAGWVRFPEAGVHRVSFGVDRTPDQLLTSFDQSGLTSFTARPGGSVFTAGTVMPHEGGALLDLHFGWSVALPTVEAVIDHLLPQVKRLEAPSAGDVPRLLLIGFDDATQILGISPSEKTRCVKCLRMHNPLKTNCP